MPTCMTGIYCLLAFLQTCSGTSLIANVFILVSGMWTICEKKGAIRMAMKRRERERGGVMMHLKFERSFRIFWSSLLLTAGGVSGVPWPGCSLPACLLKVPHPFLRPAAMKHSLSLYHQLLLHQERSRWYARAYLFYAFDNMDGGSEMHVRKRMREVYHPRSLVGAGISGGHSLQSDLWGCVIGDGKKSSRQ